nr:unnamed protein product [Spirometra erinaceieuropaei]
MAVEVIERDAGEDLPCNVRRRNSSVIITELPVPFPPVEVNICRVLEDLRGWRFRSVLVFTLSSWFTAASEIVVFTRAVSALGKLGDDLYFECGAGELSLRCVNSSRSAYAAAFFSTNFFEKASGLEDRDDTPRFKLTAKAAISFGETVGSPLVVHSGRPGKPLILTFTDDNRFSAHFVLATLPLTTGSRKRLETSTFSTNITTSISAEEDAHLPTCLTKAAPPTSTLPPTSQPDHERTLVHTQTADTQILPASPHQTPEARLPSARQDDKPFTVRSNNGYEPVPKKARSVLFSRLDNTFFENAPPAQAPELLTAFDSADEAETEDVPMAERDDITIKRQPLTNIVTPNRAALSGWGDRTVPGRKPPSNVTLLVADSDEEEG